MAKVEPDPRCAHNQIPMKKALCLALLFAAASPGRTQEATPSPAPATPEPTPAADPAALAPVLREKVNLAETESAESMEIPVPADAPDPGQPGEEAGQLPGDEEVRTRPPVSGTVQVTASDNGKIVNASVGNLVRISLESNPSTGYNWELRNFEYGSADFYSSDTVPRQGGNVFLGAPGDTVITLQAVQPGTQNIEVVYRRPWEAPDQVAATFAFRLEVSGAPAPTQPAPANSPAP